MRHLVIIVSYNNKAHITDAIKSVKAQLEPAFECVIVDNGSTDDTRQVAQDCMGHDARFRLLPKTNEGPSAGRNYGLRHAGHSDTVTFLDGDDLLKPEFLQMLGSHLASHPECGLVACQFDRIAADGTSIGAGFRSRFAPGLLGVPRQLPDSEIVTPFAAFFCATGQGPFAMFRRSVLDQTTLYEEGFWSHEDSDIFCQMSLYAEVHSLPNRLYIKRTHANNLTKVGRSNYSEFRQKWDWYHLAHPEFTSSILAARRYYYRFHRPLRDFKVALKTAKLFCKEPSLAKIQWMMTLLKSGFNGLLRGGKNPVGAPADLSSPEKT
jgi:glycosyltransferase involved in cell wall biosynthesis